MRRFAQETSVSVFRSKAEIEELLSRYGATEFLSGSRIDQAVIGFRMADRSVRFNLPLPDKNERRFTHTESRGSRRHPEAAQVEWEQACRSRWRALCLAIKAKLESVAIGITTFEDEFMAHIVLPGGETVGNTIRHRIAEQYSGNDVPLLPPPLPRQGGE